jgi:Holliday junction resolvasome RuvABC endonuclease subunit
VSTVIGLDLSLVRTGVAFWQDGQMATWSVGHGTDSGKSYPARNRRIVSQLTAVVRTIRRAPESEPITLAVIEGPILHGPQNGAFFDRAGLWHGVYSQLMAWKVPTAVVNNATLKVFATGKGNADKAMMLHAAREYWPRVGNHDEADAAMLAGMGLAKAGDYPPFALTPWRLSAIERVEWPNLVGVV